MERITDWDDAYTNAAYIPGAEDIRAHWPEAASAFRAVQTPKQIPYGSAPRQMLDLFLPTGTPAGLAVFVHGGYWMALSGSDFSHLAQGALARGFAVAVPSYTLAPEATIPEITAEIGRAITRAAAEVEGPIFLAGHSAGGHLATRMVCTGSLDQLITSRVVHVLSIAGVHDLRPLLQTAMATDLRLTPAIARAESPALLQPINDTRLTCVVGAEERPEFLRQTDLLANVWTGLGAACRAIHLPGKHHFDVIDGLASDDGDLTKLWLDQPLS